MPDNSTGKHLKAAKGDGGGIDGNELGFCVICHFERHDSLGLKYREVAETCSQRIPFVIVLAKTYAECLSA